MIHIAGENVVDLVPTTGGDLRPVLGGGPANTAIAVACLGAEVSFAGRFSDDSFGRAFRRRLADAGVDLSHAVDLPRPSALALAALNGAGVATYEFWLDGAADFAAYPLPATGAGDIRHVGSLAAYWPPGADAIEEWVTSGAPVTFDVNLRPIVLRRQPDARRRLERLVRLADVVKASDEDVRLAYPDADPEAVGRSWVSEGKARLAVVTLGARGVMAVTRDGRRAHVPAMAVDVADTIGAGDAAMGALLALLASGGVDGLIENLPESLRFVAAAAALACTRPGAYAPRRADVEAVFAGEVR